MSSSRGRCRLCRVTDKYHRLWGISCNTHHTACQQHITNRMGVTDKYHRLWAISCNNTHHTACQQHITNRMGWQTNTTDSGVSPATTHTSYSLSATHYKQDGGDRQIPQTLGYLLQQHAHHTACQQHITNRMGVTDKYHRLWGISCNNTHIIQLVSNTLQTGWGWQTNTTDSGVSPATTHTSYSLSATHYKHDGGDRQIPQTLGYLLQQHTHHTACQQHITNRMGVTDKYHRLGGISCNNTHIIQLVSNTLQTGWGWQTNTTAPGVSPATTHTSYSLSATHYKQDGGDRQIPQTLGYLLQQHAHHTACQQHITNRMGVTDKYHRLWGISCNNTHHTACQQHTTNRMGVTDKYHRLGGISCNNTHIIQLVSNTLQTGWGWQTNTTDSGVSPATTRTSYSLSATHYKQDGGDRQIPQTLGYLLQHTHHTACQQHTTNRMGVTDKYHRLWGISCNTHIIQLVSNTLQTGWGWQTNTTDSGVSPATTHTSYSLSATHYKQDGGDRQIPQTLGYLLQQHTHHTACQQHITNRMGVTDKYHRLGGISCNNTHIIQLVSNTLQTGWGWQTNTTAPGVSPATTHTSYSLSATHYKQDGGDRQIPQTLGYLLQQHAHHTACQQHITNRMGVTDKYHRLWGISCNNTHHTACQQHTTNRMGVTDKYHRLGGISCNNTHIIQLVSNTLQTGWGWQTNTTDSGVSPATIRTSYSLSATHYKQDGGDRQIPQTLGYLLQHTHHTACQQHTTNRMGVTDKYHRLWGISCNTHIIQLVSNTLQTGWGWQTNTTDSGVSPATTRTSYSLSATHYKQDGGDRQIPQTLGYLLQQHTHHTACQQHTTNRMGWQTNTTDSGVSPATTRTSYSLSARHYKQDGVTDKYHILWGISCNNTHHTACQQHTTNRMGVTDKYHRLGGISCNNTHIIQLVSNTLQTGWGWQTNTTDSGVSPATTHHTACQQHTTNRMGVTDKYHRLWGISCNTHIIQLVSNTLQTGWGWQTNTTDSGVSPATHTSYSLWATHYKQDGGDRQIPQTLGYLLQQHTHHTACQQHITNRMGVTDKYHRLWGISCNNTHIIQLVSNTLQTGWGWQTNTTDSGVSPATTRTSYSLSARHYKQDGGDRQIPQTLGYLLQQHAHHTACQQHITNRMGVTDKYHRLWGIFCNTHIIQLVSNTLQTGWGWQTNTTDSGVSPATHTSYSLSATHYKQDGGDRQIPQTLGYLLQQHTHHAACQQHITNRMGVTDKYHRLWGISCNNTHIIQLVSNTLQTGWGWQTNTTDSGVSPATHTSYSLSATHYKQDGGDRQIPQTLGYLLQQHII